MNDEVIVALLECFSGFVVGIVVTLVVTKDNHKTQVESKRELFGNEINRLHDDINHINVQVKKQEWNINYLMSCNQDNRKEISDLWDVIKLLTQSKPSEDKVNTKD
jgi:peptidoglycan hydrolase CwlO-like protein